MQRTTLEQWRMLAAVIQHGGFNQAADVIHKSQSTIHHAVHKLEESLDLKLIEVKGRVVHLTAAGETLLRRANGLLAEVARIERVAQSLSEGIESQLKIAVDQVFPQSVLYDILHEVSSEFPLLRIELMETVLSGANELLEQGEVDVVVTPTPVHNLFCEELCAIEFVAVASPIHRLFNGEQPLALADLKSCRQIVIRDSALDSKANEGWLEADQRWTVSHIRTSIDMVSSGFGYAWLPTSHIQPLLESGTLKPLPLQSGSKRKVQTYLMFTDADRLGLAARSFLGQLRLATLDLPELETGD